MYANGNRRKITPDGSQTNLLIAPDPRFGKSNPFTSQILQTKGFYRNVTMVQSVVLKNPLGFTSIDTYVTKSEDNRWQSTSKYYGTERKWEFIDPDLGVTTQLVSDNPAVSGKMSPRI